MPEACECVTIVTGKGEVLRHRRLSRGEVRHALLAAVIGIALLAPAGSPPPAPESAQAASLPSGFQEEIVFSGLTEPTAVRFSPDGRVFVAEKSGLDQGLRQPVDTTPTVFADLRTQVHNFWDRGLLGLALAPNFPTNPWVYVLYTYDAAIGGDARRAGDRSGGTSDGCPTPPGATDDGCVVAGRLSRLRPPATSMIGSEQVLIEGWCQQYPSHSIGSLAFGADGALYVSGGDGASFNFVDYGQDGAPLNPCGDPPGGVGGTLTPPTAEGGALRSQDLRTTGDPSGSTGRSCGSIPPPAPGFPTTRGVEQRRQRSADHRLRPAQPVPHHGPARHQRVWIGDVGWNDWEEINRLVEPDRGAGRELRLAVLRGRRPPGRLRRGEPHICENLYAERDRRGRRRPTSATTTTSSSCPTRCARRAARRLPAPRSRSTAAARIRPSTRRVVLRRLHPRCIWVMPDRRERTARHLEAHARSSPAPPSRSTCRSARRRSLLRRPRGHDPPHPLLQPESTADRRRHGQPDERRGALDGRLRRRASSDPDGDVLTYAWDLDGDGAFDDATTATASFTYTQPGTYTARSGHRPVGGERHVVGHRSRRATRRRPP